MNKTNNNAKMAFFYLLSLVSLGFFAIGSGVVLFQLINKLVPDLLIYGDNFFSQSAVKFGLSSIIIAAPLYYFLTCRSKILIAKGEFDSNSPIRRWLTYFILFVASVVSLSRLVILFGRFFDGDFNLKIILQSLVIFLIAGLIFFYYLDDIKNNRQAKSLINQLFFYGTIFLVILIIIGAFLIIDSPKVARAKKIDQMTINNMMQIESAISSYFTKEKKLPPDLQTLVSNNNYYLNDQSIVSPHNNKVFVYQIINDKKYNLCADFLRSNKEDDKFGTFYGTRKFIHEAGYYCLEFEATDFDTVKPMPVE